MFGLGLSLFGRQPNGAGTRVVCITLPSLNRLICIALDQLADVAG
ncbi:hypothetical protein PAMC26577_38130 [Caballeronia sordidicola]|uniref:Uncharacterized protein n=1 Tax=Caballeronia sordidicola TaxID=196367 RepID=A0A242M540_CABSO|nr:hypothetical protein PAMC26577_38130 [Caballeronia sordidicola]